MKLHQMTPTEIDNAWAEAVAPATRLYERANAKDNTGARYRKAGGHYVEQAERYEQEAHELRIEARELRDAAEAPFVAEWNRRGGWNRAYIVPGGHIHRTTSCHTLHPTTIVGWLPELSGHDEDEIVEHAGIVACTVCYPSAPVERLIAEAAAAKAATECPGSRTYEHDSSGVRYASPRAHCNHCGQTVSLTSTGKMRAHKPVTS